MNEELLFLLVTAASLGFLHTLLGPDHYIPFIMMSKAGNWSWGKTIRITVLCGLGHVGSSIVIGLVGIILGLSIAKIELFEGFRGSIAAWLLVGFGLAYFIYGCRRAYKNKPHTHVHLHEDGIAHKHEHKHHKTHAHVHAEKSNSKITPWALFIIFAFGPCEILVPLLMYPAAQKSPTAIILVSLVFSLATIATMVASVLVAVFSLHKIPLKGIEKYSHAIAGATLALCGLGIIYLGF
ncbi:MAG: sulfite exporter TauE/SafE family protein [Bacteroidales bacterium]|nr:sulfite exporter TauE/SafE family protein [Bacteroidales bacterium]MCF8458897.1 sulfite exporter TauE/SafE family protein [Bacteroidales bacterium]